MEEGLCGNKQHHPITKKSSDEDFLIRMMCFYFRLNDVYLNRKAFLVKGRELMVAEKIKGLQIKSKIVKKLYFQEKTAISF